MILSPYLTTVSVVASNRDLTVTANVRERIPVGLTVTDAAINSSITRISKQITAICNREFASETLVDVFRIARSGVSLSALTYPTNGVMNRAVNALRLSRFPVASITSVVEDGVTLATNLYELIPQRGLLNRLDGSDNQIDWTAGKVTVTFIAGYALPASTPSDLEAVAIDMVLADLYRIGRDPLLRSLTNPGVIEQSWFDPDKTKTVQGVPEDIEYRLRDYMTNPV